MLPEIAETPWRTISVDFVTGLPLTTSGYNAILTVVDRCTKMVHLIKCTDTCDSTQFAQLMQDHVYAKHGLPTDIIHDRDPRFTGHFTKAVNEALGLHQSQTSAWHPQSDGQTERMNRTLEQVLRAHTAQYSKEWDETLSLVEFAINNSAHAGLRHTPFFLNTGLNPITPIMLEAIKLDKQIHCPAAQTYLTLRSEAFQAAMQHLRAARDRYKSYADLNRKDTQFQVGQEVLLSTTNLNKHDLCRKLYPKYVGPFKVLKKVNDTAYMLDLPASMPIHNVFHVSLLCAYVKGKTPTPPPVPITVNGELEYEVERVLDHRDKTTSSQKGAHGQRQKRVKREYLVKWLGYGIHEATWEKESNMANAQEAIQDYWAQHDKLAQAAKDRQASAGLKRHTSVPNPKNPKRLRINFMI